MQGQRGTINSLPESLSFEHDSSDPGVIEHQICWNNNLNTTNQETQNVTMWSMGESSSSSGPNQVGSSRIEPKTEHGWPSLTKSCPEPHPYESQASMLSLGDVNMNMTHNHANNGHHGPLFVQNSNVTVNPSSFIGIKPTNYSETYPGSSSSDPFQLEARQLPIKRKAVELSAGQSSSSSSGISSSNTFQSPEITENPLGLGVTGANSENPIVENTRRNVRLRINNNSRQQDSLPDNNNNNNNNHNVQSNLSSYPSLRLNPVDLNSSNRRNLQVSSRWNRGSGSSSSSRTNRSSNVSISGDNSRTIPSNISDHPIFIQPNEVRNATQNAVNWSLNGNGVAPSSAMPPHYPSRRLSEILRRSLLSAPEGQNGNFFSRIPPPVGASVSFSSSSQDAGVPPVIGVPGHHHHHLLHSRSSDRQLDGAFGFPYLSRTMVAGSEGRGRLVSEIRNVLDLIRRGEGLRFEDVMILDRTMLYGMADIHDRHRDMRLDIDNMSYEELLALEERIGNVNTGLTEETISSRLKLKTYVTVTGQPDAEPCCICQEEFKNGDDLGALECGHDFHTNCVKQWLLQKNVCPVCKSTAFATTK